VLIISLTIVQISIAFIKSVRKQVSKGMLRELDLDYKDNKKSFTSNRRNLTSLTNKSMGLTDCAKLISV
jgi:hypothetical protein